MAQAAFQWWTGSTKLRGSHQPVDRRVAVAMGFEPVQPRDPKGQDVDALHGVEKITKAITPSTGGVIGGEKSPCETYIEYILSWYVPQLWTKTFRVEEPHEKEKIWGSSFPRRKELSIMTTHNIVIFGGDHCDPEVYYMSETHRCEDGPRENSLANVCLAREL